MDDDDQTAERFLDLARRCDIGGHVLVFRFRSNKAAIERINNDEAGLRISGLRLDAGDQPVGVNDKIERVGD